MLPVGSDLDKKLWGYSNREDGQGQLQETLGESDQHKATTRKVAQATQFLGARGMKILLWLATWTRYIHLTPTSHFLGPRLSSLFRQSTRVSIKTEDLSWAHECHMCVSIGPTIRFQCGKVECYLCTNICVLATVFPVW